jgi:hypothetical protein
MESSMNGKVYKLQHSMFGASDEYLKRFSSDIDAIEFFTVMWNDTRECKDINDSRERARKYGLQLLVNTYRHKDHASWHVARLDLENIGNEIETWMPWTIILTLDMYRFNHFDKVWLEKVTVKPEWAINQCDFCCSKERMKHGDDIYEVKIGEDDGSVITCTCIECGKKAIDFIKSIEKGDDEMRKEKLVKWWLEKINEHDGKSIQL